MKQFSEFSTVFWYAMVRDDGDDQVVDYTEET